MDLQTPYIIFRNRTQDRQIRLFLQDNGIRFRGRKSSLFIVPEKFASYLYYAGLLENVRTAFISSPQPVTFYKLHMQEFHKYMKDEAVLLKTASLNEENPLQNSENTLNFSNELRRRSEIL